VRYPAQRLQSTDQLLHGLWGQLHHFDDGLFQSLDPRAHMLDFVHTIPQRGLLRRLWVADLLEPSPVTLCPRLHSQRRTLTRTQQELG